MDRDILAVDVGTTSFKLAVYTPALEKKVEVVQPYDINVYDRVRADIEPEKWWDALRRSCAEASSYLGNVGVLSMAVTTPGLTPMDAEGAALGPAILFFDGRSHAQARSIREQLGESYFLERACNLPVSGGSSLCSIMWIRDEQPDVFAATAMFGHTNTFLVKRLTGEWAIDQTTTSITGLYNTRDDDLTWNEEVLEAVGLPATKLPPLYRSHTSVGTVLPDVAEDLGLPGDVAVLAGGNDAVLGALSAGVTESGDAISIIGTAEITYVCVDRPVASPRFNLRCHVIPDRWLTFFVLNAGGKAFEWFKSVFCADMSSASFYDDYMPQVIDSFLADPTVSQREEHLPVYAPYLGGSRYSLNVETAAFTGLDLETTRDEMLLALIRGNAQYSGSHLVEVGGVITLGGTVTAAGSASKINSLMDARRRWFGDYEFAYRDQSSLHGAGILGQLYVERSQQGANTSASNLGGSATATKGARLDRKPD